MAVNLRWLIELQDDCDAHVDVVTRLVDDPKRGDDSVLKAPVDVVIISKSSIVPPITAFRRVCTIFSQAISKNPTTTNAKQAFMYLLTDC